MKPAEPTESEQPMFSVIVTSYNNKKHFPEALESVLSQNSGYSYEIVVGDDGSTDGARDLLLEYQAKYPDIIRLIFNEKNMGAMPNYFNILSNCRGKYLTLCADDDFWLPGKAKAQVDYLEANPDVGVVYGQARLLYEDPTYENDCKYKDILGGPGETFDIIIKANQLPAVTVMWRRELALKYIDEEKPLDKGWMTEDYAMRLWFSINSKIKFIPQTFAVHRIWTGSVSHPDTNLKLMTFRASLAEIKRYYARQYYDEVPAKWRKPTCFAFSREPSWRMTGKR